MGSGVRGNILTGQVEHGLCQLNHDGTKSAAISEGHVLGARTLGLSPGTQSYEDICFTQRSIHKSQNCLYVRLVR